MKKSGGPDRVKSMMRNNVVPPHPHIDHFNAHKLKRGSHLLRSNTISNPNMDQEFEER
jgi:hypothetical protein